MRFLTDLGYASMSEFQALPPSQQRLSRMVLPARRQASIDGDCRIGESHGHAGFSKNRRRIFHRPAPRPASASSATAISSDLISGSALAGEQG